MKLRFTEEHGFAAVRHRCVGRSISTGVRFVGTVIASLRQLKDWRRTATIDKADASERKCNRTK